MKLRVATIGAVAMVLLSAGIALALTYQWSGGNRYLPNGTVTLYDNASPPNPIGTTTISGVTSFGSGGNWSSTIGGFPAGSGAFTWGGTYPNEGGQVYDTAGNHVADFQAATTSNTFCIITAPGGGAVAGYIQ